MSLGPKLVTRLRDLLGPLDTINGTSDFDWNMICLAPYLHRYWSKAYFGLKWVENSKPEPSFMEDNVEYSHYQVEWNWLPAKISHKFEKFLCGPQGPKGNGPRMVDLEAAEIEPGWISSPADAPAISARPLESGHILKLKAKTADLEKTQTLIEAQWIVLKIAVLCGAADVADKLDGNPPPRFCEEIEDWLKSLPQLRARSETDSDEI